jgi:RimJ/RimL family protein N-acetyltransferase
MKNYEQIEILTSRLLLRAPRIEDAKETNAALQKVWHELQLWMSWAHEGEQTLEATERYIRSVPEIVKNGGLPLKGFCRETGKFVVSTGISLNGEKHETGYWVAKDFLGKGYATEACNATIRYAFGAMDAKCMFINYFDGNEKSRRIIEKLGFTKTGVLEKHNARCLDGELRDEHQYEMRDPAVLPELEVKWRQRCP